MNQHEAVPYTSNRLQVAGLIVVIVAGAALIGVIVWAAITGRTSAALRADESARLQFELTRAQTCAITGALATPPTDRSSERVQMIVNDCMQQVGLPFDVNIEVPEEE